MDKSIVAEEEEENTLSNNSIISAEYKVTNIIKKNIVTEMCQCYNDNFIYDILQFLANIVQLCLCGAHLTLDHLVRDVLHGLGLKLLAHHQQHLPWL